MTDDYYAKLRQSGFKYEPYKMVLLQIDQRPNDKVAASFRRVIEEESDNGKKLITEILAYISVRTDKIHSIIEVLKILFENMEENTPIHQFNKYLFNACFKSASSYRLKTPHFNFLREMMKAGIYNITQIGNKIAKFPHTQGNTFFVLFLFFSPELCISRKTTYTNTLDRLTKCENVEKCLREIGDQYEKFAQNKHAILKDILDRGSGPIAITDCVQRDDIDGFMKFIDDPSKADRVIGKIPLEVHSFLQNSPWLIEYCAYFGAHQCIDHLIQLGAQGHQACKYAIAAGRIDTVKFLIAKEFDSTKLVSTALATFRYDLLDEIHQILHDEQYNKQLSYALFKFARKGDIIAMTYILNLGIDINSVDIAGCSAVMYAVNENNMKSLEFLYNLGADMHVADITDWNILHFAAYNGNLELFKFILTIPGFNINMKTGYGATPLHLAAEKQYHDLIFFILDYPDVELEGRDAKGNGFIQLIENPALKQEIEDYLEKKHQFILI